MQLAGIEALKKSGAESRYLLLEVYLWRGQEAEVAKLIVRGFEVPYNSHAVVAGEFLREELKPTVTPYFDLPEEWPEKTGSQEPRQYIESETEGLRLVVFAAGGGKFDLKNNAINLRDKSVAFGPVPKKYEGQFKALLEELVQRPAYRGFRVNFG
jgi:hypothetical protein